MRDVIMGYTNKSQNYGAYGSLSNGPKMRAGGNGLLQEPIQKGTKIEILVHAARCGSVEKSKEAVKQLEKIAGVVGDHTENAIEGLSLLVIISNKANNSAFRALCSLSTNLEPSIKDKAKEEIKHLSENAEDASIRIKAKEFTV
jgi:hypothetical protein